MTNVRLIALALAGFLLLIIIMNNLRRKQAQQLETPEIGDIDYFEDDNDELLGVKKISTDPVAAPQTARPVNTARPQTEPTAASNPTSDLVVIHCVAKDGHGFAGYELLQELLSCGLRYGEMNIFHRYEDEAGLEVVQFSVASADEPGTFDLDQMGAYQCRGLSLFMRCRHDGRDAHRYQLMQQTAQTLADELDGELINQQIAAEEAVA